MLLCNNPLLLCVNFALITIRCVNWRATGFAVRAARSQSFPIMRPPIAVSLISG